MRRPRTANRLSTSRGLQYSLALAPRAQQLLLPPPRQQHTGSRRGGAGFVRGLQQRRGQPVLLLRFLRTARARTAMAYVPRHRRPNAVAQQNSPTAREAREARADKHAELRPLTPRQPVTNSKAETGMRTGTGTGTETGTETVQEPETQLETPQLRWMQLCSHPELTAASELASVTCDKLVDAGKLRTRPPYVRQDREDLLAGVFAECGLDGGKMCSLGRTQAVWDLEPLIRGATRGETWVDDVLKELNSLLSEVFCWAAACDGQQEMQEAEDMIADSDTLSVSDNSSASTHHSISTSAIPIKQTLHAHDGSLDSIRHLFTDQRLQLTYDLDYETPRATDPEDRLAEDHMAPNNKLHYMGRVGSVDVPLGLGRQSVREAKIVSPTGR